MIDAVIERCAGIDVGKKFILVCTLCGPSNEAPQVEVRTYGTTNHALQTLERWLFELGCLHVVMESTGDYWKPIFNILEERMTVVLANPAHIKNTLVAKQMCKTASGWRICCATV
jgi:transposase